MSKKSHLNPLVIILSILLTASIVYIFKMQNPTSREKKPETATNSPTADKENAPTPSEITNINKIGRTASERQLQRV